MSTPALRMVLTAGSGAAAAFVPSSIAGLDVWYDATQIVGKNDGDPISQWNDLSGNALHLTQATGADQPLYKTNIRNAQPIVRFDGTSDFIRNSSITARTAGTIFCVAIKRSAIDATDRGLFDVSATASRIGVHQATSATNWAWSLNQAAGFNDTTISSQAWHIVTVRYTSASSLTVRGEGGAAAVTLDPDDSVTTGTRITVGHSGSFCDVDVGEFLRYSTALSTGNMDLVGTYLASKWGFTWTATS